MNEEMIQFARNVSPEASALLIVGKLREQRERIQAELDRIDAEIQTQLATVQMNTRLETAPLDIPVVSDDGEGLGD